MKWKNRKPARPVTPEQRARDAFAELSAASLRYFGAIAPDVPEDARKRIAVALDNGGRLLTAISVKDGRSTVLITLHHEDGAAERLHLLDSYGVLSMPPDTARPTAGPVGQ